MTSPQSDNGRFSNAKFSALFLLLHVCGVLIAGRSLIRAWNMRTILEVYWGKLTWLACLCIIAVVLLGVAEVSQVFLRWRQRKPESDVGLRLRGLVYIAIGCVGLHVTMIQVRSPVMADISIALAYGVYLLWLRWLPQIRSRVNQHVRRVCDLACMNVSLALILAEVSLRIVTVISPMPLLITSETPVSARLQANRVPPGTLRYGFPINQDGHFDTPFEMTKKKLVASIGDSFANAGVPHPYHFTTVCERQLGDVEVYNMGFPAIGPREYLQLLETEALPLKPDLIVLQIFVGNDLTEASEIKARAPSWYEPDRYLTTILWRRIRVLGQDGRIDVRTGIRDALPGHDELAAQLPWLENPLLETPTFAQDLFLNIETQRARAICGPDQHSYHYFFKSVRKIVHAAGEIPVAFVLIPDEFQVSDSLWQQIVSKLDPSGGPYDRDRPQRKILERLEFCGVPVLNLLPALRAAELLEDGKRHVYHLQDTHFNVRGHAIAGVELAGFLDALLTATPVSHQKLAGDNMIQQSEFDPGTRTITQLVFGQPRCDQIMVDGWSLDESSDNASYVWSEGPKSILDMKLPVGEDVVMEFECQPFVFPGSRDQSIEVYFNGNFITRIALDSGRQKYAITVARQWLSDNPDMSNIIEFRYAHLNRPVDVLPNSTDNRRLAACWYRLSVSRTVDNVPAGIRH